MVVALYGELDLASSPSLERELLGADSETLDRVVIDLSGLEFIDCSGLHVILRAKERFREDGRQLSLLRGPRAVQRLFELTGTLRFFCFEHGTRSRKPRQGRDDGQSPSHPAGSPVNPGSVLAYRAGGDVQVFALERAGRGSAMWTLERRMRGVTTGKHRPSCVVVDTTGTEHLKPASVTSLVHQVEAAARSGIQVAVVSSEPGVRDALSQADIDDLLIAPTVSQALEICGHSRRA
jgi:anti-sigma B factor antagonist